MLDYQIKSNFTEADYLGAATIFINDEDTATFEAKTASGIISAAAASAVDSSTSPNKYSVTSSLLLNSISFELADRHLLLEYFGDTFTTVFFGRDPLLLNCSGELSALKGSNTKRNFMALYRDVLRLRKVARHGIVPCISFTGAIAKGAFIDLQIMRNSSVNDFYAISFRFLVFNLIFLNKTNSSEITTLELKFS